MNLNRLAVDARNAWGFSTLTEETPSQLVQQFSSFATVLVLAAGGEITVKAGALLDINRPHTIEVTRDPVTLDTTFRVRMGQPENHNEGI